MAVTVRDVAKKAGVSLGTVSRYLNGYKLREENREKVEKAIKELGFKENILAKGLKTNRSMTIGVLISTLTDIFSTSIVSAIEKEVEKENYSLIICDYGGYSDVLNKKLNFLRDRMVDGIILFSYTSMGYSEMLEGLNQCIKDRIPLVIVNDDIPELKTDKVLVDNASGSFRAVERLIHLNHRDIAIINGDRISYTSLERYKGYQEALQTYGIPENKQWVKWGNFTNTGGYTAVKELLQSPRRPTAIYITNYYMTLGAMMAIYEMNVQVPDEVSIVGFDRFELSDVIKPKLTVIEQPLEQMGIEIGRLILKRLQDDYSDFPKKRLVQSRLVIRESDRPI